MARVTIATACTYDVDATATVPGSVTVMGDLDSLVDADITGTGCTSIVINIHSDTSGRLTMDTVAYSGPITFQGMDAPSDHGTESGMFQIQGVTGNIYNYGPLVFDEIRRNAYFTTYTVRNLELTKFGTSGSVGNSNLIGTPIVEDAVIEDVYAVDEVYATSGGSAHFYTDGFAQATHSYTLTRVSVLSSPHWKPVRWLAYASTLDPPEAGFLKVTDLTIVDCPFHYEYLLGDMSASEGLSIAGTLAEQFLVEIDGISLSDTTGDGAHTLVQVFPEIATNSYIRNINIYDLTCFRPSYCGDVGARTLSIYVQPLIDVPSPFVEVSNISVIDSSCGTILRVAAPEGDTTMVTNVHFSNFVAQNDCSVYSHDTTVHVEGAIVVEYGPASAANTPVISGLIVDGYSNPTFTESEISIYSYLTTMPPVVFRMTGDFLPHQMWKYPHARINNVRISGYSSPAGFPALCIEDLEVLLRVEGRSYVEYVTPVSTLTTTLAGRVLVGGKAAATLPAPCGVPTSTDNVSGAESSFDWEGCPTNGCFASETLGRCGACISAVEPSSDAPCPSTLPAVVTGEVVTYYINTATNAFSNSGLSSTEALGTLTEVLVRARERGVDTLEVVVLHESTRPKVPALNDLVLPGENVTIRVSVSDGTLVSGSLFANDEKYFVGVLNGGTLTIDGGGELISKFPTANLALVKAEEGATLTIKKSILGYYSSNSIGISATHHDFSLLEVVTEAGSNSGASLRSLALEDLEVVGDSTVGGLIAASNAKLAMYHESYVLQASTTVSVMNVSFSGSVHLQVEGATVEVDTVSASAGTSSTFPTLALSASTSMNASNLEILANAQVSLYSAASLEITNSALTGFSGAVRSSGSSHVLDVEAGIGPLTMTNFTVSDATFTPSTDLKSLVNVAAGSDITANDLVIADSTILEASPTSTLGVSFFSFKSDSGVGIRGLSIEGSSTHPSAPYSGAVTAAGFRDVNGVTVANNPGGLSILNGTWPSIGAAIGRSLSDIDITDTLLHGGVWIYHLAGEATPESATLSRINIGSGVSIVDCSQPVFDLDAETVTITGSSISGVTSSSLTEGGSTILSGTYFSLALTSSTITNNVGCGGAIDMESAASSAGSDSTEIGVLDLSPTVEGVAYQVCEGNSPGTFTSVTPTEGFLIGSHLEGPPTQLLADFSCGCCTNTTVGVGSPKLLTGQCGEGTEVDGVWEYTCPDIFIGGEPEPEPEPEEPSVPTTGGEEDSAVNEEAELAPSFADNLSSEPAWYLGATAMGVTALVAVVFFCCKFRKNKKETVRSKAEKHHRSMTASTATESSNVATIAADGTTGSSYAVDFPTGDPSEVQTVDVSMEEGPETVVSDEFFSAPVETVVNFMDAESEAVRTLEEPDTVAVETQTNIETVMVEFQAGH